MAKRKVEEEAILEHDPSSDEIEKSEVEEQVTKTEDSEQEEDEDDDDDEEDDEEEETPKANGHSGPPTKKQRKQLSAQDIQVARETAELFKSNIFKLQIDELMKELKLKDSHVAKIEKVLHRLHELISQVPSTENLLLNQAEALFNSKKIVIPFPDPKPTKVNYTFSYVPPKDISLVGSFGLKTGIASAEGLSIDIALTMPEELFQPKDYLNYRALYKRAFYLAYLAEHLIPLSKKNNLPIKISYHFLNDDPLCPVLKLESIQTDNQKDLTFHKTKFTINLLVAFPFGFFDSKKLLPDKNCIRVQSEAAELPPTPLYNASILSSTSYDYYLKFLYTTKKTTEAFKDACILGRLWLQQRGFGSSFNKGGFGHFEFAILMSVLFNGGGLNGNKILLHGFSSYQLFKGTIKYLSSMDLSNDGYVSFSSLIGENVPSKYNSGGFGVPTIFDKNTKLNVLWKMTKSSYENLQAQAKETLRLLNDVVFDRFDPILLQKSTFDQMKFDIVLNFNIPEELMESFGPLERITFISFDNYIKHKLYVILKTALNNRVNLIHIRNETPSNSYPLTKRKPSASSSMSYVVGLQLNTEESEKLVTKGPSNDDQELGMKFRSFWGSKASLRRFKDGNIQHCVVWTYTNNEPIVLTIVKFALDQHLHQQMSSTLTTDIVSFNDRLAPPLISGSSTSQGSLQSGVTSLTNYTSLISSFDDLVKIITNFTLPLQVRSISSASAALRYSSLLQPVPFAASNPDFWNDLVLEFESSTRWPDELISLEKMKTVFLLKIHELLGDSTYRSFLTTDSSIPYNQNICLLNILTPEGFGFRIRVLTERDEILYLRAITNSDKQKALLQDVYLKFNQRYMGVVKHTRTISQLATYYKFYSPTVRLFKQWLDSQLLLHHFSDELIELLAIKPFVDPAPYSIPNSVENGFLQILNFLANWNWKEVPLILDLVKSTADEDVTNPTKLSDRLNIQSFRVIELNFEKIRKNDPSGIKTQFFIGSKDDPSGILWTSNLSLPIASRLTALSRIATQLIKTQGLNETNMDLIFTPALNDFDFVIKVKSSSLTISSGILPPNKFKNLINAQTSFPDDITSQYDLIQAFVKDLSDKFGHMIIFSTKKFTGLNQDGSNVISGIFIPDCLNKKKFRANIGINVKPLEDRGDEVVINKDAIFNQITLLGDDLIESIKIRK
ncbi:Nrap protein [Suhomyces tanzawaensis NRRL Y-17324]|uniref:U3 small nucleolar RNA-associated protein 22 n=1 Tax=Suhomyces tanzawaensis NRRL Y-17324 TaxID=984487 RepID=A0A1E4SF31_9ASCO|nr:Nrap protein [Suhomyces tanzawaensis NRRL Y-17324]ODV78075.1 Nrap protein [Suhomyces tanzawaensis NRRL Y-17324]